MRTILENAAQAATVRHGADVFFRCAQCGETKPTQSEGGTGYARDDSGNLICYECCAVNDRRDMDETGRAVLYLVKTSPEDRKQWASAPYKVTNWPGTLSFPVYGIRQGRHNFAGTRIDFWFKANGRDWHGVNIGDSQIARCKRLKK